MEAKAVTTVFDSVCVRVHTCVCMCVLLSVSARTNVFYCMWRTEDNISVIAQALFTSPALSVSFNYVHLHVSLCGNVQMSTGARRSQLNPLELELQRVT